GRRRKLPIAVLGGIGFGLFIDELGKFITSDNNYFFRPTAALVYVIFVLLFLSVRAIRRRGRLSSREYLANAIDILKDAALRDVDAGEVRRARALVRLAGESEWTPPLKALIGAMEGLPARPPSRLSGLLTKAHDWYEAVVETPAFQQLT